MNHFFETLPGWFTWPELSKEMAQRFPNGSFAEIGVYAGRSFAYLGVELMNLGGSFKMLAVDNYGFISTEKFAENMKPLAGRYEIACGDSAALAANYPDGSFDLVFIDANHLEHAIRADIAAWLPKVRKGGYLAGHDYELEADRSKHLWGVAKVVDEIFGDNKRLTEECWVVGPI